MSSDSELSAFSESSNNEEDIDVSEEEDEDIKVVYSQYTPYQDQPLAEDDEEEDQDEEVDVDGLSSAVDIQENSCRELIVRIIAITLLFEVPQLNESSPRSSKISL